ncbi:MAG TPA: hypothetical protein VI999_07720 [Thermoplasmata archaeon]|nr:hypothetical protein [Thermoplasmata archaeon]
MARRCGVCGFESNAAVCPRCNTILLRGQAICRKCGKMFPGWIALCDACGADMGPEPKGPADEESVRLLASVPGITETRAKELVARGFRDFSDVVRLALPESAVKKGLHHAIARKAMLSGLEMKRAPKTGARRCPMCGAAWLAGADRCAACGSTRAPELDAGAIDRKLVQVTGEIVDLAQDEDFQEMPPAIREEILQAFGGMNGDDLLREEYRRQIDAWREKGFDVRPLERLLGTDLSSFRERGVRLIRAQILKRTEAGQYRCPLCDVPLPAAAEECENCGARFG